MASKRAFGVGAGVLVAIAAVAAWKLTRPSAVNEPPPSTFVPASAAPMAPPSAAVEDAGPPPGRTRPPQPQTYPTATSSMQKIGAQLRPMDLDILKVIESGDIGKGQDVFPDRPYKVSMMRDHLTGYVVLVTIDLTRRGVIDERWKLTPTEATRQVADEKGRFLDDYVLRGGRWMPR